MGMEITGKKAEKAIFWAVEIAVSASYSAAKQQ